MGKDHALVKVGYDITLTNLGGQIKTYGLTGYQAVPEESVSQENQAAPKWVDLTHGEVDKVYLMGLSSRGGDVALRPNDTYILKSQTANSITYEHDPRGCEGFEDIYLLRQRLFLSTHCHVAE